MSERVQSFGDSLPNIGNQIRKWRIALRMTQAELEQKAGLSHNAVSRIECESVSPRLETIERLAIAMDLTAEQLQFQIPADKVKENTKGFEVRWDVNNLVEAISKVPEPKRTILLRTFIDLVRIATEDENA